MVAVVAAHLATRNRDYYWRYFHHKTLLKLFSSTIGYLAKQPSIITTSIEFVIMLDSSLYFDQAVVAYDFVPALQYL